MALNAQIKMSLLAHETSNGDISRTLRATPANYALTLTDGTGENQAQVVWSDSRTLASAASATINLSSLQDDRGTVSFSSIKFIYIKNSAGTVSWSGGDWGGSPLDDPSAGGIFIPTGGVFAIANPSATGWAVSGGSQTIVIRNTGQSSDASYDIVLVGEGSVA